MGDLFTDVFNALSGDEFEEIPVSIEEFVEDKLQHPPLSKNQYTIIKASTQIFHFDTLMNLYEEELAVQRYKETYNEIICALGKGSGKDMMARISCAYVIYLLLCLRDPQKYFGKPTNDSIDVMNIAINADQANRVFFRQFVQLIKGCEWFDGKFDDKRNEVNFIKNINLVSGHSESESLEGYNVIFVVLDEISGFAEESTSGNKKAKTAQNIYDMHRASVDSRFPKEGKLILLSFPRYEGDFISQRYDDVVQDKIVTAKTHTFKHAAGSGAAAPLAALVARVQPGRVGRRRAVAAHRCATRPSSAFADQAHGVAARQGAARARADGCRGICAGNGRKGARGGSSCGADRRRSCQRRDAARGGTRAWPQRRGARLGTHLGKSRPRCADDGQHI